MPVTNVNCPVTAATLLLGHFNRGDIEFDDECEVTDQECHAAADQNESDLAVNLFPSGSKKSGKLLASNSIRNLKKKKLGQLLTSKSSMKRYSEDHENHDVFVKKHSADADSMGFSELSYESSGKLNGSAKKVLATSHVTNKQKLDTL
jgi:hypothetical protein